MAYIVDTFEKGAAKGDEVESSRLALIGAIEHARPDLKGQTFYCPGGHTSIVIACADEVFKGLAPEQDYQAIKIERERLVFLHGKNVPVPEVTFADKWDYFFGMKKISGVTAYTVFEKMTPDEKAGLAEDLARFMLALDAAYQSAPEEMLRLPEARRTDPVIFPKGAIDAFSDRRVIQAFGTDADFVRQEIEAYFSRLSERPMVVAHCDMHKDNVLIDERTMRMTGVIDLVDLARKMPEASFEGIASRFEPALAFAVEKNFAAASPRYSLRDCYANKLARRTQALHKRYEHSLNPAPNFSEDIAEIRDLTAALKDAVKLSKPSPTPAATTAFGASY